ncbi:MAG: histidine--tRNA ligase [Candidatus Saccharimonadales bacterium]
MHKTGKNVKIIVMVNLSPQPYKGTRDYYPEDKRIQNYIFYVWRKVSESFGYEEYSAPILEPLDIYTAKSGQELANEQTYSFVDRGGRTVAIRPEMTPTISRMVAARRQELAYPARLYSIANFMRYERPQRGREREFWQLNVDIFGSDGAIAEAEIITMADKIMKEFGAKTSDYIIKINNRKLINFMMAQYLNLDAAQAQAMIKLLDRKNKIDERDFILQASEIFGDDSDVGLEKVKLLIKANSMADLPKEITESSSVQEIRELFTLLERFDVDNITFDITLMRGLDYYTGTVFEVYDTNPENARALFGGGRYDGLVNLFGADPISAVGMAPGGTTTEDFLVTHNLLPKLDSTTDLYVATQGDVFKEASRLVSDLRYNGLNVEQDFSKRKLDRQIKTAAKKSIPYVIFVGEEEVASGIYPIKDISSGEEKKLNINEIVDLLKSS